jgi:uncharacterized damage-inducible protein DinB
MKQYLIDFFKYNDGANRKLIESVKLMPESEEAIRLISHVINSHAKWLNRVIKERDDKELAWFDKAYPLNDLEKEWSEKVNAWLAYMAKIGESDLDKEIVFERPNDGKKFKIKLRDIALQINYHSIHHRAQILPIIRKQGQTPPATDYIFTVLKEA